MAKKTILVQKVVEAVLNGKKSVTVFSGGQRYTSHRNTLATVGYRNPQRLLGKTIVVDIYDIGEKLVDGSIYEGREGGNLIKEFVTMPALTQAELIADATATAMAEMLLASVAPATPVLEAQTEQEPLENETEQQNQTEQQPEQQPAPEQTPAPEQQPAPVMQGAEILDENLPA